MADDPLVWMRARLIARELVESLVASGDRRVRTPAGAAKYGQPIGSVIVLDKPARAVKAMTRSKHTHARRAVVRQPPVPKFRPGWVTAYSGNARTPDGRVIMTEKQLRRFQKGGHSLLAHLEDGFDASGNRVKVLSKEREALHDKLVNQALTGVRPSPTGIKTYTFIGGGPGAGKSTATKQLKSYPRVREFLDVDSPPGEAVLIDGDAIKMSMPEWGQPNNKETAGFHHAESSLVAALTADAAIDRSLDIVMDGTGDKSAEHMLGKMAKAKSDGYNVNGVYVTLPTGEALVRSLVRSIETGRHMPIDPLMDIHRDVIPTVQGIEGQFNRFDLFDTDVPFKAPAIPIVTNNKIVDQARYDAFLAKVNVTNLQAAQEALRRAESKVYWAVTDKKGRTWSPEEVRAFTIREIQALIQEYST